jgi:hypothetical protein
MKFLIAFRQRKAVEPFVDFVERLVDRGHEVTIAVHERDEKVRSLFGQPDRLAFVTLPDGRRDAWADTADLARHVRDVAQYLREPYRDASKLRRRVFDRLLKRLAVPAGVASQWSADTLVDLGPEAVARLERALVHLEQAMPPDPIAMEALRHLAPDVTLATPLVHFAGTQVELVKAARALGIPVGMLLFSWDNLGTKGALHVAPDHLFVWNERQRAEAKALHAFDAGRITVTGAPRFDRFFRLTPRVERAAFCGPLGADPAAAVVLYLCSSKLVSEKEVRFLRLWVDAVRRAPSARLRQALLIVRPHPDLPLAGGKWIGEGRAFRWEGCPEVEMTARPLFGDSRALMLTADNTSPQVLYESIYHSAAVVGLNTSAEIEAGIVGRPVFTVLTDTEHADGQHTTLHFHYLTAPHGGFVHVAGSLDAHVDQLGRELDAPEPAAAWQARVAAFVRPGGWSRPASDVLADAVESVFSATSVNAAPVTAHRLAMPVESAPASAAPGLRKLVPDDARGVVRVDGAGGDLWSVSDDGASVVLSAGSRRGLEWLTARLRPGAVLYDLSAGDGLFAIAAAQRIGCTVLAFEAAVPALTRLWQNVLLNGCDGLVAPIPLRPDRQSVLQQERYDRLTSHAGRLPLRMSRWREHDPAPGAEVIQPVMTMPLEWAVKRWKLPAPQAFRVLIAAGEGGIVSAIEPMLADPGVESMVLEGSQADLEAVASRFGRFGFTRAPLERDDASGVIAMAREPTDPASNPRWRFLKARLRH